MAGWGVEKNLEKAAELYALAAEQGNSAAQYSLGTCYENGDGVKANLEEAVRLYRLAAECGNAYA